MVKGHLQLLKYVLEKIAYGQLKQNGAVLPQHLVNSTSKYLRRSWYRVPQQHHNPKHALKQRKQTDFFLSFPNSSGLNPL